MKKTQKKKSSGRKKSPARREPVKAAPRKRQISDSARALALFCADLIEAKRGFDVTILNVSKDLQITDYFVICSGRNKKQNQAIAYTFLDNYSRLARYGCSKPSYNSMQGFEEGQWIVVDLGAVVVHIFSEQLRQYYDLEFLWSSAPKVKRK